MYTFSIFIHRQLQELESKFKEFYSQSLSNKDDRIKVLDSRIEELTDENNHLKEDLKELRVIVDRLKETGSPRAISRSHSPREISRLREQVADGLRIKDKLHAAHEEVSIFYHFLHSRNSPGFDLYDYVSFCIIKFITWVNL